MKSVVALLVAFVCMGVLFRKFDNKARFFLILAAVCMIAYVTIK